MQIFVKTLKGTHFEIEVKSDDTIADVKNFIEASKGTSVYPADQQMLIHQGKVLKDETTLAENNVSERSFLVIMLRKPPTSSSALANPAAPAPAPAPASNPDLLHTTEPTTAAINPMLTAAPLVEAYDEAASNLVASNSLEQAIQRILDIGGGTWDRETVVRAMRVAFNNPDRAVEYLYSGIPGQTENLVTQPPTGEQETTIPPPAPTPPPEQPAFSLTGPNSNPLNLFPQGLPSGGSNAGASNFDFLRNSPQFRALQAMVQDNPQILQPMLLELGRQNPQIMRLIQDHQAEFLTLINESSEGGDNSLDQLSEEMPQSVVVTLEESEAIERLEAMGFDRALAVEIFFACGKDEEAAANYLLDHIHEFEDEER